MEERKVKMRLREWGGVARFSKNFYLRGEVERIWMVVLRWHSWVCRACRSPGLFRKGI